MIKFLNLLVLIFVIGKIHSGHKSNHLGLNVDVNEYDYDEPTTTTTTRRTTSRTTTRRTTRRTTTTTQAAEELDPSVQKLLQSMSFFDESLFENALLKVLNNVYAKLDDLNKAHKALKPSSDLFPELNRVLESILRSKKLKESDLAFLDEFFAFVKLCLTKNLEVLDILDGLNLKLTFPQLRTFFSTLRKKLGVDWLKVEGRLGALKALGNVDPSIYTSGLEAALDDILELFKIRNIDQAAAGNLLPNLFNNRKFKARELNQLKDFLFPIVGLGNNPNAILSALEKLKIPRNMPIPTILDFFKNLLDLLKSVQNPEKIIDELSNKDFSTLVDPKALKEAVDAASNPVDPKVAAIVDDLLKKLTSGSPNKDDANNLAGQVASLFKLAPNDANLLQDGLNNLNISPKVTPSELNTILSNLKEALSEIKPSNSLLTATLMNLLVYLKKDDLMNLNTVKSVVNRLNDELKRIKLTPTLSKSLAQLVGKAIGNCACYTPDGLVNSVKAIIDFMNKSCNLGKAL